MVGRVDARLYPLARRGGFEPCEGIYRLGDWGYVREDDYLAAFEPEPEWAATVYMLDGNRPDEAGEWCRLYNTGGVDALDRRLTDSFIREDPDCVFYTTANDDGSC
ncbi:hypothetical protein [Bifidobacterium eulemuris]|nr:hypothetical protein [Bifidobacterium eulemuris]